MYSVVETLPDTELSAPRDVSLVRWRLGTRIAFRFCAAYFTLYILASQMISSLAGLPELSQLPTLEHADDVDGDQRDGVQQAAGDPERQRGQAVRLGARRQPARGCCSGDGRVVGGRTGRAPATLVRAPGSTSSSASRSVPR